MERNGSRPSAAPEEPVTARLRRRMEALPVAEPDVTRLSSATALSAWIVGRTDRPPARKGMGMSAGP
jgi:hypothetical protein